MNRLKCFTAAFHLLLLLCFFSTNSIEAVTVTKVRPTRGCPEGGSAVYIIGTNFSNVTAVKFGASNALSFTVLTPILIRAIAPAGSLLTTVDITVTTTTSTSPITNADHFTY